MYLNGLKNILDLSTNFKITYRESYNMFSSNMRNKLTDEEIDYIKKIEENQTILNFNDSISIWFYTRYVMW